MNAELTFLHRPAIPAQPHAGWKHGFYYPSGRLRYSLGDADSAAAGVPQNAAGRLRAGSGAPHRRCPLQSSSQAAGGPRPSMRHPHGGTAAYPAPGRFLLPFGPYGGVLRLGDSPLAGREKAVGDGGSAGRRSHRILADVPLCPLPDGYSGWCHFGSRLRMGGSMARKESRAPNGHPAELKKEGETAVQQLAVRRSLLL